MREWRRHSATVDSPRIADAGSDARPRLLFLSCHLPWPANSGGRRRELELIKRIASRFHVHLLVVSKTFDQDLANAWVLRRYCRSVEVYRASFKAERAGGDGQAPQVARHHCDAMRNRVAKIIARRDVDLIHVEGFYLMQHVPKGAEPPLLLVEQNVEYDLERQRAAATADHGAVRRPTLTEAAEVACWRRATQVAAVTTEDGEMIQAALEGSMVRVVPDGADHVSNLRVVGSDPDVEDPGAPLVVLLANFGYAPNVDAARFAAERILPRVCERVPDAKLWLVGNAPPPEVTALENENVMVTGRVPDVLPYLDAANVIVCPVRIGGGIKVKTIEALRRGKAIVSTSVGAQGLSGPARDAIVIADDPRSFADSVSALLLDGQTRGEVERRAAAAATQLPSWDDAADALVSLYDGLLAQGPGASTKCGFAGDAAAGGSA